jgi:Fe-S-cluster containining protein
MKPRDPDRPWYHEGLAFTCTRCGACCTGAPGYVWVSIDEIEDLARHRGETLEQFSAKFVRQVGTHHSLVERPNGDCIFWDRQAGCTVYAARPAQCRAWPFWPENLETPEQWQRIERICPGAGQGQMHTLDQIIESIGMVHT